MSEIEPFDALKDADEDTERRLGAFPDPPLDQCPVAPLGFDGAHLVFAMPEGEIRKELASKIGMMLRADIFACVAGQAFLTYWRDSDDKFQRDLCAVWFVRRCRAAGKWDDRRAVRSLGVWPGEPGEVILHKGDEIRRYGAAGWTAETVAQALRRRDGPLYKLFPASRAPGEPASADDGRWLRDQLDLWRFEPVGDDGLSGADLAAGAMMSGMLGAVPPFRAHLLINALAGSGKTTLMEFIHAAQSALAGGLMNSFTEAGLRADLAGMARPVVLDEVEGGSGETGPGAVEQALNLLRLMATGEGAARKMGGDKGSSVTQTAVGSVIMAAILPPRLDTALATRVAEVRLLPLNGSDLAPDDPRPKVGTPAQIEAAMTKAQALAPRLLARALMGARRYLADAAAVKAALVNLGEDRRSCDLISALAAGRRLLMHDAPLTAGEAEDEAAFWMPLLRDREKTENVRNPGADALAHLLNWESGLIRSGRRVTIGELVTSTVTPGDTLYDPELKTFGLRIERGPGKGGREGPWLLVSNNHPALERIFGKTRWADWRKSLSYLDQLGPDHATWCVKPLNYGPGAKQRGLAIPLTPLLEEPIRRGAEGRSGDRSGDGHDF